MADELSPQQKIDLIKSNLQEVLKPDIIEDVIIKQNRPLRIYWGKHIHHRLALTVSNFLSQERPPRVAHTAATLYPWSR